MNAKKKNAIFRIIADRFDARLIVLECSHRGRFREIEHDSIIEFLRAGHVNLAMEGLAFQMYLWGTRSKQHWAFNRDIVNLLAETAGAVARVRGAK